MCVEGKVCDGCMYVDVGKMRLLSLSIITNSAVITQPRDPGPISHHTTPGQRENLEFFQCDIDTVTVSATVDPKLVILIVL